MTQQLVVSWGSVRDIYVICCDFTSSQHKHSLCSQHISWYHCVAAVLIAEMRDYN